MREELDVDECYRRATEARRIADSRGVDEAERADLLEVERRWLSLACSFEPRREETSAVSRDYPKTAASEN